MTRLLQSLRAVSLLFVLFLIVSCGKKIDQSTYEQIKKEMTMDQVKDLLGEPTESKSAGIGPLSGSLTSWKDGDKAITVTFVNGKATIIAKTGF